MTSATHVALRYCNPSSSARARVLSAAVPSAVALLAVARATVAAAAARARVRVAPAAVAVSAAVVAAAAGVARVPVRAAVDHSQLARFTGLSTTMAAPPEGLSASPKGDAAGR